MTTFDIAQEALGEFLCADLENDKNGTIQFNVGQNPSDAQAVRAILNSVTKNLLKLNVEWEEPVVVKNKQQNSVSLGYSLLGNVEKQVLSNLQTVDSARIINDIREDLAFKIPSPLLDRHVAKSSYRLQDEKFTFITKEDFCALLNAWGSKYKCKGLRTQSCDNSLAVTVGGDDAKKFHEQEQLGYQLNKVALTQGFKQQAGAGRGKN